jgi:hypothetical protein
VLEKNFDANPSDLIYWPDEWFQDKDMLHVDLTPEEIAGYLMAKSGRRLSDAPQSSEVSDTFKYVRYISAQFVDVERMG